MRTPVWARRATNRTLLTIAVAAVAAVVAGGASGMVPRSAAGLTSAGHVFRSRLFAWGARILHTTPAGKQALSKPDDITSLGGDIYVAFQNGVGPQGQPSTTGDRDSTVVEFDLHGQRMAQWDLVGKCDGLTADPALGKVIATVNEDANSSLYTIAPAGGATHYRYSAPLPSRGGTDAIEIYQGMVLISASAPGTTGTAAPRPTYPAVYRAVLDARTHVVRLSPLFFDEAMATVANTNSSKHGRRTRLGLTDPDSNEVVPAYAHRFAGEFILTSQGDLEQIFVAGAGTARQTLSVLTLTASVDDTAWPSSSAGALYVTDNGADTIDRVTGSFSRGSEIVATTPCNANSAPTTCPAPGFPANYLGAVNPDTGSISRLRVRGTAVEPQGLLFLP